MPNINLPSTQGFKYMHPGIVDFIFRLNPIDNLLTTPFRTFNKIIRNAVKTGTNSLLFAQSLPLGLGNFRRNSQHFKHRFYNDANAIRQMSQASGGVPILKPLNAEIVNNNNNRGRTDVIVIPSSIPSKIVPQPEVAVAAVAPRTTPKPLAVKP